MNRARWIAVVAVVLVVAVAGTAVGILVTRNNGGHKQGETEGPCVTTSADNATGDVPRWSPFTITLTDQTSHVDPYTETTVRATFRGPRGATKSVNGYWDGGQTFRVRFTPTVEGRWSYATQSPDRGLDQQHGSFTAVGPKSANCGFIRRDRINPAGFVYDNGRHYFMMGQTYYEIVRNAAAAGAWKHAVEMSARNGMTKVRLLVYPWGDKPYRYPDSQPFAGPKTAPNHDELNLAHWRALDEIVQELGRQGMAADLILFTDAGRVFGTQQQDERYARYVIARYAAYPNVIWDVSNEWDGTGKPKTFFDSIGQLIRNEDPWMDDGGNLRPLSIHQKTSYTFGFFSDQWPVHAIVQVGQRNDNPRYDRGDQWGDTSITANWGHAVPVVNDEYGYFGETDTRSGKTVTIDRVTARNALWAIRTAGGYATAGDNQKVDGQPAWLTGDWVDSPDYLDIKRCVAFWTQAGLDYWKFGPQNSVITAGTRAYAGGNPGHQYVVYAAIGADVDVNLPAPVGASSYTVTRFNPRTGASVSLPSVPGGSRQYRLPAGNDWVLYFNASS